MIVVTNCHDFAVFSVKMTEMLYSVPVLMTKEFVFLHFSYLTPPCAYTLGGKCEIIHVGRKSFSKFSDAAGKRLKQSIEAAANHNVFIVSNTTNPDRTH